MIEIKFRAWDKSRSKFHNSGNLHIEVSPNGTLCWSFGMEMCEPLVGKERDNWLLMQYTGLKDKNGVEIYEGDIVKIIDPHVETLGEVKYWSESGSAYATFGIMGSGTFSDVMNYGNGRQLEVIGNIYENGDLLK